MEPRINYLEAAPGAVRAVYGLETYLRSSGLDQKLLHLIKLRVSQLNGCAYCLEMHAREARERDGRQAGRFGAHAPSTARRANSSGR